MERLYGINHNMRIISLKLSCYNSLVFSSLQNTFSIESGVTFARKTIVNNKNIRNVTVKSLGRDFINGSTYKLMPEYNLSLKDESAHNIIRKSTKKYRSSNKPGEIETIQNIQQNEQQVVNKEKENSRENFKNLNQKKSAFKNNNSTWNQLLISKYDYKNRNDNQNQIKLEKKNKNEVENQNENENKNNDWEALSSPYYGSTLFAKSKYKRLLHFIDSRLLDWTTSHYSDHDIKQLIITILDTKLYEGDYLKDKKLEKEILLRKISLCKYIANKFKQDSILGNNFVIEECLIKKFPELGVEHFIWMTKCESPLDKHSFTKALKCVHNMFNDNSKIPVKHLTFIFTKIYDFYQSKLPPEVVASIFKTYARLDMHAKVFQLYEKLSLNLYSSKNYEDNVFNDRTYTILFNYIYRTGKISPDKKYFNFLILWKDCEKLILAKKIQLNNKLIISAARALTNQFNKKKRNEINTDDPDSLSSKQYQMIQKIYHEYFNLPYRIDKNDKNNNKNTNMSKYLLYMDNESLHVLLKACLLHRQYDDGLYYYKFYTEINNETAARIIPDVHNMLTMIMICNRVKSVMPEVYKEKYFLLATQLSSTLDMMKK